MPPVLGLSAAGKKAFSRGKTMNLRRFCAMQQANLTPPDADRQGDRDKKGGGLRSDEWIDERQPPINHLLVLHVFRVQRVAAEFKRGGNDQAIPIR